MAKWKRLNVGSVIKSNNKDKPNYMKFRLRMTNGKELVPGGQLHISDGDTLSVESKAFQIASAQKALENGKITPEMYANVMKRVEAIPEFVLGEIILSKKES